MQSSTKPMQTTDEKIAQAQKRIAELELLITHWKKQNGLQDKRI